MRRPCKCRVWYQRYSQMYLNLIQQGVTKGSALMALRECHKMMDEAKSYRRYFIAQSAEDSINCIEFEIHNPKNVVVKKEKESKKIEIGTREVMICKATNLEVEMEYVGVFSDDGKINGHRGWMCLHDPRDVYIL